MISANFSIHFSSNRRCSKLKMGLNIGVFGARSLVLFGCMSQLAGLEANVNCGHRMRLEFSSRFHGVRFKNRLTRNISITWSFLLKWRWLKMNFVNLTWGIGKTWDWRNCRTDERTIVAHEKANTSLNASIYLGIAISRNDVNNLYVWEKRTGLKPGNRRYNFFSELLWQMKSRWMIMRRWNPIRNGLVSTKQAYWKGILFWLLYEINCFQSNHN